MSDFAYAMVLAAIFWIVTGPVWFALWMGWLSG